jgi:hypothetical protein
MNNDDILSKFNRNFSLNYQQKDVTHRQTIRLNPSKSFRCLQIIEICLLAFILFEHTFIFILTFRRKSLKRNQR